MQIINNVTKLERCGVCNSIKKLFPCRSCDNRICIDCISLAVQSDPAENLYVVFGECCYAQTYARRIKAKGEKGYAEIDIYR